MNKENEEIKKEELTDDQVEKATGGATMTCPFCRKVITYNQTLPRTCPYCGKSIGGGKLQ